MTKTMKKCLSLMLVLVQILVLLPIGMTHAEAAKSVPETPVLNETVVGTVQFQSFNFLGDNSTGSDGVDYTSTFYYTDDFFSPSAIHETNSASLKWSDMTENEKSLASTSFDLTVAAYASNENNVLTATSRTWDNTYYPGKDKNAKAMLETCGFTNFESYSTYNQAPINDSIAYVIASKPITVWDETSQSNKDFTLIAVAVRGAGYGAEWASNVTIGNKDTNQLPANGRHWGFDDAAVTICAGIRSYLSAHNITSDAKYWITGFSRAGAAANLVAGYVTDGAESIYHTHQRDVYGFTWECPKGAAKSETALNYKNIHNFINAMDAVPKVSPDAFQHQRLGVDYVMPYYGNTSTSENTAYYTQMREVLKTIAVGAYNYKGETYTEDPLIEYTDPANYPYNREMTVYTITALQLLGDAADGVLMENFGTVTATGSNKKLTDKYIDKFIDDLIQVFLVSGAWSGKIGASNTTTALSNRTKYISDYQTHFRNVLGYLLDYSGPAFLGMVDAMVDAIGDQLSLTNSATNIGVGLAFLNFYNYPTSTYVFPTLGIFNDPWIGKISWRNRSRREVLVEEAQPVVKNVVRNMVGNFVDPQGITRAQFEASMDKLVELVVNLYADELSRYNSNYFGTTLHYMWQILCVHEQEVVMSWIKSLDSNHMNRSSRTLTVPASADVKLYEFRDQYGEQPTDEETTAPVVAEIHNGAFVADTLKDQRITLSTSGNSIVIRYPASLELRADVKATANVNLNTVSVKDYQTKAAATKLSDGESQFSDGLPSASYTNVTNTTSATNAKAKNTDLSSYGTLEAGDTLHVLVNDIQTFNSDGETTTYNLSIDKAPDITVLDYGTPGGAYTDGTDQPSAVSLGIDTTVSTNTLSNRTITTRQKQITVPASNVYFDDELTGNSVASYEGKTTQLDSAEEGKTVWYQFCGTRIDLYCTTDASSGYVQAMVFKNNNGELGERVAVKTINCNSEKLRYNVPTISFDGLDANTDYYLKIYAIKGANYRLDGIRVYHSADESDTAVQEAYEAVGEQDAKYVNLRALLLGSVSEETLTEANEAGALFYTDSGTSYTLTSDEYVTNSPKNEVYLSPGQSVAFQIIGTYEKVAVGMSAPDSLTGGGSVTVTNGEGTKTQPIVNALDQYYSVTPASDGSVMITNSGNDLISITNVKLSGDYTAPVSGQSLDVPLTVSKSLMRYAVSFSELPDTTPEEHEIPLEIPAPTEEPTMTPTPSSTPEATPVPTLTPTPANPNSDTSVMQLISSFVKSLFSGFSRLFRP